MKQSVVARVRLVIDVPCGTWDPACTVAEIVERAGREGTQKVVNLFTDLGTGQFRHSYNEVRGWRVVDGPTVQVIVAEAGP